MKGREKYYFICKSSRHHNTLCLQREKKPGVCFRDAKKDKLVKAEVFPLQEIAKMDMGAEAVTKVKGQSM